MSKEQVYFTGVIESELTLGQLLVAWNPRLLMELSEEIKSGKILLFPRTASSNLCRDLITYFSGLLGSVLEKYVPIEVACENYVRFSHGDPRATVPLYCDSLSFFAWNRDRLDLFDRFSDVYRLKNLFAGADLERYLDGRSHDDTVARIAAHFYPSGRGHLGCHTDPRGNHQEITCTLLLQKPDNHREEGYYVLNHKGRKVFVESELNVGDFYIGSPDLAHGVEQISGEFSPLSSAGRWALLFPVNKTASNKLVGDSINVS